MDRFRDREIAKHYVVYADMCAVHWETLSRCGTSWSRGDGAAAVPDDDDGDGMDGVQYWMMSPRSLAMHT